MRRIAEVCALPLEAPLVDPFVVATARLDRLRNVAVAVTLDDGSVGWGEVPTLWPITAERFEDAVAAVQDVAEELGGADPLRISEVLRLPGRPATAAGIEQAAWDAVARSRGIPLWRLFGDAGAEVVSDVTLPIASLERTAELARTWRSRGFATLKVKTGRDLDDDIRRLGAIVAAFPDAALILDANEGWTVEQTLRALAAVRRAGGRVVLLEQPVRRDDLEGMARLVREAGVDVAADETCQSADDVARIARDRLATVVNIKLAKSGVAGGLAIVEAARREGLALMIGGMVESRIGMGFAAHLAAGVGGFAFVDLDTPLLLAADPVEGGTPLIGPRWGVAGAGPGHGGTRRPHPSSAPLH